MILLEYFIRYIMKKNFFCSFQAIICYFVFLPVTIKRIISIALFPIFLVLIISINAITTLLFASLPHYLLGYDIKLIIFIP